MAKRKDTLEDLVTFFSKKNILITGHTGFKGSWLGMLLNVLEANLYGISITQNENNILYKDLDLSKIYNKEKFMDLGLKNENLDEFIESNKIDIVFHLAAQPIVSEGVNFPVETFKSNIMGTVNLLEALKKSPPQYIQVITSDKCYQNSGDIRFFNENDSLGGDDPYSASKSCQEIVSNSYFKTYFKDMGIKMNTVRAGNIIGGGDMSLNRIIPDIVKSIFLEKKVLNIRQPYAVRPWQNVIDPCFAYVTLAKKNIEGSVDSFAYNFGPDKESFKNVEELCKVVKKKIFPDFNYILNEKNIYKEHKNLFLDNSLSKEELGIKNKLDFESSLQFTFNWYKEFYSNRDMFQYSKLIIKDFIND